MEFNKLKGQMSLKGAAIAVTVANERFGHKFPHNTLGTWLKFYEGLTEFQLKSLLAAHGTHNFSQKVKISHTHDLNAFFTDPPRSNATPPRCP